MDPNANDHKIGMYSYLQDDGRFTQHMGINVSVFKRKVRFRTEHAVDSPHSSPYKNPL